MGRKRSNDIIEIQNDFIFKLFNYIILFVFRAPLDDLDDCDLSKYCLQLNVYK